MAQKNLSKLHKLIIEVYTDSLRKGSPKDTFTVMFNPSSVSMHYENQFQKLQGANTSSREAMYSYGQSDELNLDLILDGTGVTDYGLTKLNGLDATDVSAQINKFLKLCVYMNGDIHEPNFLRIQWGDSVLKNFDCRVKSVDIEYTSFDRNGAPLRANLKTVFIEDLDTSKRLRIEEKNSPDLSHFLVVKKGDTLPMLAKEIYGSSEYYFSVALVNKLDNFRNLTPGQTLSFPPIKR